MKGSILIYGGNLKARQEKAAYIQETLKVRTNGVDFKSIDVYEGKKSIGIDQIRDITAFLSKKPYEGENKCVVIPQAEKLTVDAQNAFLKTLEEPPVYASIILCSKTQNDLLPTVISRCQKLPIDDRQSRVGESDGKGSPENIDKIKKMNAQDKFTWAQEMAKEEKDTIIELLEEWVRLERKSMVKNSQSANNIKVITEVKGDLEKTNVNTRLALDYLLVNLV